METWDNADYKYLYFWNPQPGLLHVSSCVKECPNFGVGQAETFNGHKISKYYKSGGTAKLECRNKEDDIQSVKAMGTNKVDTCQGDLGIALLGQFNALMSGAGLADAPADPSSDPNPVQRFIYNSVP